MEGYFVHSGVKNAFYSEEVLVGQPMSVVVEDLNELDEKFKNQGFLKGIDVKIKFEDIANRIVKLHLAIPTLLSNSEGIAYILTLSDQQLASINNLHKNLQEKNTVDDLINFEKNCSKLELTPTETKIACLLVKGYTSKEIAGKFFRSTFTVEKHLQNMRFKVGVKTKSELISYLKSSIQ